MSYIALASFVVASLAFFVAGAALLVVLDIREERRQHHQRVERLVKSGVIR